MDEWVITDWAGNRMVPGYTFESFEDGWEFVREQCPEDSWQDIYVEKLEK